MFQGTIYAAVTRADVQAALAALLKTLGVKEGPGRTAEKIAAAKLELAEGVLPAFADIQQRVKKGSPGTGAGSLDLSHLPLGFSTGGDPSKPPLHGTLHF